MKDSKVLKIAAILFILGVTFFALKTLQEILLPFFIAVIIAFIFEPFFELLKKKKVPSFLAIIIVILCIVIIANITSIFVLTSIGPFTAGIPKYQDKFTSLIEYATNSLKNFGFDANAFKESMNLKNLVKDSSVQGWITSLFTSIAGIFGDFVLIIIYVAFILSELGSLKRRVLRAFSEERARTIAKTMGDIFLDVRRYIVGKTLINLIHAIVIGIILWAFNVDFYIVWAFLSFLMNYIPTIGSMIATVLPFMTALVQFDSFGVAIVILIILIVLANVVGNVIEPQVLGDKLDLSPILLLLSLILWGYIWGIMGMILSIPIMSMIKIVLMNFESTRPVAILMSYNQSSITDIKEKQKYTHVIKKILKGKKKDDNSKN
ncbi:MAG: AI-2E family transporter [Bacteroidetes bacterium]|nr:AI-2E family transporter [Bacteroidota bacterium]